MSGITGVQFPYGLRTYSDHVRNRHSLSCYCHGKGNLMPRVKSMAASALPLNYNTHQQIITLLPWLWVTMLIRYVCFTMQSLVPVFSMVSSSGITIRSSVTTYSWVRYCCVNHNIITTGGVWWMISPYHNGPDCVLIGQNRYQSSDDIWKHDWQL